MKKMNYWLEQFRKIWKSRFDQLNDVLVTLKKENK